VTTEERTGHGFAQVPKSQPGEEEPPPPPESEKVALFQSRSMEPARRRVGSAHRKGCSS
jgi:hypothetical protein